MIELKTSGISADDFGRIWFTTGIKAPQYWWDAFEHKILRHIEDYGSTLEMESIKEVIEKREILASDFSYEFLGEEARSILNDTVRVLNNQRWLYLKLKSAEYRKNYWYALMQSLPSSYNLSGKWRYTLNDVKVIFKVLKPKILGNEYEFKEFADFFEYLENLVEGFSL